MAFVKLVTNKSGEVVGEIWQDMRKGKYLARAIFPGHNRSESVGKFASWKAAERAIKQYVY
jgi:hypothetical protein